MPEEYYLIKFRMPDGSVGWAKATEEEIRADPRIAEVIFPNRNWRKYGEGLK
jgi:hypothetical protein